MEKTDDSFLYSIPLDETGFLSDGSVELLDFLDNNDIDTVGELIKIVRDKSYKVPTYRDVMAEIYGLIDMISCKYLDMPLVSSIYLEVPIRYSSYEILGEKHVILSVRTDNDKKHRKVGTNIYTVINRLGFNDKERTILLDKRENFLFDKTLIEIFTEEYNKIKEKETLTSDEMVLVNKLLFYINYCENRKKTDGALDIDYETSLIGDYAKLVSIRDGLDDSIRMSSEKKADSYKKGGRR